MRKTIEHKKYENCFKIHQNERYWRILLELASRYTCIAYTCVRIANVYGSDGPAG